MLKNVGTESKTSNIIIIGVGGHGSELYAYLHDLLGFDSKIRFIGFVDEHKPQGQWAGTKILGNLKQLRNFLLKNRRSKFYYITATGDNLRRKELVQKIENSGVDNLMPWILRHPSSVVGKDVEIGKGTCLAPGSMVTMNAKLGRHCILNINASVSHDCVIGDFVNINPSAVICGNVRLGEGCYIGANATVIDKVSIGDWTVIGAGAVVIEDIPSGVTAVGVPAKIVKKNA